jgi:hypothetical protein
MLTRLIAFVLSATVIVCLISFVDMNGVSASQEAVFPVYPYAAVQSISPYFAEQQQIFATFIAKDKPTVIGEWYVNELLSYGYVIRSSDVGEDEDSCGVFAEHKGWDVEAEVNTMWNDQNKQTMIVCKLNGSGVYEGIFEGQESTIPDIGDDTGIGDNDYTEVSASDLAQSTAAYIDALNAFYAAMEKFCKNPTVTTAQAAVDEADTLIEASDSMTEVTVSSADDGKNPFAGMEFVQGSSMNIQLGLVIFFLELAIENPERMQEVHDTVCPILEELRKNQLPRFQSVADSAEEYRKQTEEYGEWDSFSDASPLTHELLIEVNDPLPEPSTKLTMTRLFTPTKKYWASHLTETYINLKNWAMGCPDNDYDVDTDGDGQNDAYYCQAFGLIRGNEPDGRRCLGSTRTKELEVEVLSDPMDCYALAALAIEVGDSEQMKQGGKITVWINNEYLMTVPLPSDPLTSASFNPWDAETTTFAHGVTLTGVSAIADAYLNGVREVYGEAAAAYTKAAYRMNSAVTEATGGEFNGYVYFLHIGQQIIVPAEDPREAVMLISPCEEHPLEIAKKLIEIAENNHPALKNKSVIKLQAEVGGVVSEPVEYELQAPFTNIADYAGKWSGWPGGSEMDWNVGQELGPEPQPEYPPRIEVQPGNGMKMMEDAKKYARACQLLILEPWMKMVQEMAIDAVVDYGTGMGDAQTPNTDAFYESFRNSKGGGYVGKTVSKLKDWVKNHGKGFASEYFDKTINDMIKDYIGQSIDTVTGTVLFQTGLDLANKVYITQDTTYQGLTMDAKMKISHHRYLMWDIATLAKTELELWQGLDDPLSSSMDIVESFATKAVTDEIFRPINWGRRTIYGLDAVHHLYSIYKIQVELHEIEKILMDPNSWIKS